MQNTETAASPSRPSPSTTNSGVMDFAHQWNATFPIGWDGHHQDAECWHIGTMPTTAVVDRMGIIRFWHDGSHDGEAAKIAEEIESLL